MPVAGECFEDIFKPRGVAERDDIAVALSVKRLARPIAHHPAGTFDDGDKRGEVMELEAALDDEVNVAAREQRIIVTVAAPDQAAVRGFGGKRHEMSGLVIAETMRAGGGKDGVTQRRARPRFGGFSVHQRRLADRANPPFAQNRLVDQPEYRPATLHQRDQRAKDWPPRDKAGGAVDRINHPLPRRRVTHASKLLTDDPVTRAFGFENIANRGFARAVGTCDGRRIGLALKPEFSAVKRADRSPCGVGKAVRKRGVVVGRYFDRPVIQIMALT